ncbi:hypothetical protein AOLI_G00160360 [Acnodon oligacanthus]
MVSSKTQASWQITSRSGTVSSAWARQWLQHITSTIGKQEGSWTSKYCAPAWSRSPHVNKVDTAINSTLQIVTGCLKPTPASYMPVLAGITPASLRRDAVTLSLARKAQMYDWHILHKATITLAPLGRLKSRHPYNKSAQEMLQSIPEDLSRDAWLAATWRQTWEMAGPSHIQQYIRDPGGVKEEDLLRHLWTLLNPLRTGVGLFKSSLKKWGLSDRAACECGKPEQTAEHIINGCPLYNPPSAAGLFDLGPKTRAWLHGTELAN